MKKNIIFCAIVIFFITMGGQIGKSKFCDQGLSSVHTLEDLEKFSFYFESIDNESDTLYYHEYRDEYMQDYELCEYILIVIPTGKYEMGTSVGIQEVRVEKVIRGTEELMGEKIWIDGMPGLAYYEEEEKLYIDALTNYMQTENKYLLFCNAYGPVALKEKSNISKYYYTDSFFGRLNITKLENTGIVLDPNDSYTYNELKEYEFFGTCQSVLDEKQKIKDMLVKKYLEKAVHNR